MRSVVLLATLLAFVLAQAGCGSAGSEPVKDTRPISNHRIPVMPKKK
jgi:hypothetical protein